MDIPGIRNRILKHLPAYLLKYGFVDMPSIGRLVLDAHGSTIDHAKSVIFPPFYEVRLDQGQDSQAHNYVAFLAKRLGLDDALISEVYIDFTTSVVRDLNHGESIRLEGLGALSQIEEGAIGFVSDSSFWGITAVEKLAIAFIPVPRIKDKADVEEEIVVPTSLPIHSVLDEDTSFDVGQMEWEDESIVDSPKEEDQEPSDNKEEERNEVLPLPTPGSDRNTMLGAKLAQASQAQSEEAPAGQYVDVHASQPTKKKQNRKRDWLMIPLMFVLLMLLAVPLFFYLTSSHSAENENDNTEIVNSIPEDRLNAAPKLNQDSDKADGESTQEGNLISADTENSDIAGSASSSTNQSEANHEAASKSIEPQNSTSQPASPVQTPELKVESPPANIVHGECVVIVGAYGSKTNMRKMLSLLKNRGYSVYVDSTRSLSRVGVYSQCQNEALQSTLNRVQTEVEPNSWVLK